MCNDQYRMFLSFFLLLLLFFFFFLFFLFLFFSSSFFKFQDRTFAPLFMKLVQHKNTETHFYMPALE